MKQDEDPAVASVQPVIERHPVAESLRTELLKLAKDGDPKHNGALTEEILMRIMRVAKTGRELLVSLNVSGSNLSSLLRRPRRPGYLSFAGQDYDNIEDPQSVEPFAYTSPNENFGMTAIRELMSVAKNLNGGNSPVKLVEALAIAREKGLTDVETALENQLGMAKPVTLAEAPKPADGKVA